MKVLVTGANGFVGRSILSRLNSMHNVDAIGSLRSLDKCDKAESGEVLKSTYVAVDQLSADTCWRAALNKVDLVVHTAARVHFMQEVAPDPFSEFRIVNVQGTLNLARQAVEAGVRRFVFISSIKVNGEATELGRAFTADDSPAPQDPYGLSKMEAEQGLKVIANQTGMEVAIIRPPLVYGPGVKANFAVMINALRSGVPLPLGAIHNLRSFVALDNLVDLVVTCLDHPAAANQTFLVSDGEDVSTTELLRRMGLALGLRSRLLPVPESFLRLAADLVGKQDAFKRLCGSLQVDIEKTRSLLGWIPPISLDVGLSRAARYL